MSTPDQLNAMTDEEFVDRVNQLPPSEFYLETMLWVWSMEPWKDAPGGWDWGVVMQGYENLKRMENG